MNNGNKHAAKEIDKLTAVMEMTPTTKMMLDYENGYTHHIRYREYDINKPAEIKFTPPQLLPFLQQESEFWDQFKPETFDVKCKLVRMLQKHLFKQRKTKKWLTAKLLENEGRTDLRKIEIPVESIYTPATQSPLKKDKKSPAAPSKRVKSATVS